MGVPADGGGGVMPDSVMFLMSALALAGVLILAEKMR